MIVVDLGCATQGGDESITRLIERFQPDVLYGFDPLADEKMTANNVALSAIHIERKAAWIEDGYIPLAVGAGGLDATLIDEKSGRGEWSEAVEVPCFDFSRWLYEIAMRSAERIVVKMDVEGAEFPVLEKMNADGTDTLVHLLLVEWHTEKLGKGYGEQKERLLAQLRCPVEEWK